MNELVSTQMEVWWEEKDNDMMREKSDESDTNRWKACKRSDRKKESCDYLQSPRRD